jgi:hypothetical protein
MLRYTYTACLVLFRVCEDGRIIPQRRQQMLLTASFLISVQCHCRSISKGSVVFAVVVTVAVLSTSSNFSAFYSSQQVVGGRCFFRRYRSGCCKWSALAASLVQWPRGDLIMPVKTRALCPHPAWWCCYSVCLVLFRECTDMPPVWYWPGFFMEFVFYPHVLAARN